MTVFLVLYCRWNRPVPFRRNPILPIWLLLFVLAGCVDLPFSRGMGSASVQVTTAVTTGGSTEIGMSNLYANLRAHEGQILFKSNRDGAERIYIMEPDGANQQPFEPMGLYTEASKLESFAPQRDRQVAVQHFGQGQYLFLRDVQTEIYRQLTGGSWTYYSPTWSPNAQHIAYVAEVNSISLIYVVAVENGATTPLLPPTIGAASHPTWSPDGSQIAFTLEREGRRQIWVADADGRSPRTLTDHAYDDWDPIWIKAFISGYAEMDSARGQLALGWAFDDCLVRVEAVDRQGGKTPITRVKVVVGGKAVFDSETLSVQSYRRTIELQQPPGAYEVELLAWNSGDYREQPYVHSSTLYCYAAESAGQITPTPTPHVIEPTPAPADIFEAATRVAQASATLMPQTPLPEGAVIATPTPQPVVITNTPTPENAATRLYHQAYLEAMIATTGTPTPVPYWWITATSTPTDTSTPTATPTPSATPTPITIPWKPRGGSPATPLPTPTQSIPVVLRGRILFKSNRDGKTEIFVMDPDGANIEKLTAAWPYEQAVRQDAVSANGTYRVFVRESFDHYQIFFYDAQYLVDHQVSAMGAGASWDPAIEPGGWRIAFVSNEPGNDEIFVVNRDGSDLRRLTQNDWEWDRHPSWSPDGNEIVFWSNRTGRQQLYVMGQDGGDLRRISDGIADDWDPVWVK